jgi:predicted transcriptional regulator
MAVAIAEYVFSSRRPCAFRKVCNRNLSVYFSSPVTSVIGSAFTCPARFTPLPVSGTG